MKKLLLTLLGLVFTFSLCGQGITNQVMTWNTTTNLAGASTNTWAAGTTNYIPTLYGKDLSISWRFQCNLANTGNFVLTLQPAIEAYKPNTIGIGHRWVIPANGVTEQVWVTNLTVNAYGGYYITLLENTNTAGITNSVFMYRVK